MIPVFIIWLIRRYRQSQKKLKTDPLSLKKEKRQSSRLATVLFLTAITAAIQGHSQAGSRLYEIMRNGSKVGTLRFSETSSAGMDYLKMESDVRTRFIFTFTAHANEDAVYCNGILLRSSIYRRLNGNEKANKQHEADIRQYIIHKGHDTEVTKIFPITYNMLSLYSREPENIHEVYSDNFEQFIAIQKTGEHTYKITLPDGNYNNYSYRNGILNLIEVHHSLYSANIVLMN